MKQRCILHTLIISSIISRVYSFYGVQINSHTNDVVIKNPRNITCNQAEKEVKINNKFFCGSECDNHRQTVYSGQACAEDASILIENGCINVGVFNDISLDSIQTVTVSKLLSDLYIYYKDLSEENIKSAHRCSFVNEECPILLRNQTSSKWEVSGLSSCFSFATDSAHMQFTCEATRANELEGFLLKTNVSCQLSKESETTNHCVLFKVEGTQLVNSSRLSSPICPLIPAGVVPTPIPANNDNFDDSKGWIIMSIMIFILSLILLGVIKWIYMREPKKYAVNENHETEAQDPVDTEATMESSSSRKQNGNDVPDSAHAFTNEALDVKESNTKLSVKTVQMPSYAKIIREKIKHKKAKPPRTFSKKSLITSENDSPENNNTLNNHFNPYAEVKDDIPKVVIQTSDTNSTMSHNSLPKNFYEEIPLKQTKVIKPKRTKFSVKKKEKEDPQSDTYLSPKEVQDEIDSKSQDESTANQILWKSQALKRQNFFKENSLLKQLQKKKLTLSSETSEEGKEDTLEKKNRSIASTNSDEAVTLPFERNKNKPVYTNKDTVVPVEALRQFDEVDAFTGSPTKNSKPSTNSLEKKDTLSVEEADKEPELDKNDAPFLPRKHRTVSWYGNNDVIVDKTYQKPPKIRSERSKSEGSATLYYDMIPTIKGDKESSIRINFRRPIPKELDLIRLPYSQFNYGLRKRSDGNSSCNGFCLLLASHFLESPSSLEPSDLRLQIPNFLYKAEKIWNEGNLGSTSVEEAHDILKKLHNATYRVSLGDELFWSIHQGLGGFSPFQALHEVYDKCVNSSTKECLIITFYPDKSCLCVFDEFGNQAFIDLHIHFKTNHQKRNAALQDNECGGVICKAAKHTSDVLLNFLTSNMCLEMKADPNTGSAYPLSKRKDYELI